MSSPRYLFICGLHRSGTTMMARSLAQHPQISGFTRTGAIEDEGQFLQSVFPLERMFGGVGRFGFDPHARFTESSSLNKPETAAKLRSDWGRYWDLEKTVLLEKTPSNLLRMRLLQQLLQPSAFVIVTRHPIAVSLASLKWTEGNIFSLLVHWAHCYRLAREDAACLERAIWISYEAFVADPASHLARIAELVDLAPAESWASTQTTNQNLPYFDLWRQQYLGDLSREIGQKAPRRQRSLATRMREKLAYRREQSRLPFYRRAHNLRDFYDALDAVSFLEPMIEQFGYSLIDLVRAPHDASEKIATHPY